MRLIKQIAKASSRQRLRFFFFSSRAARDFAHIYIPCKRNGSWGLFLFREASAAAAAFRQLSRFRVSVAIVRRARAETIGR